MSDEESASEITETSYETTETTTEAPDTTTGASETCTEATEDSTSQATETTNTTIGIEEEDDDCDSEWNAGAFLLPQDILKLNERHIRSEDPHWAVSPVPELAEIIVKAARYVEGPELENLLENATEDQRKRILQKLPLNIPPKYTLPIDDLDAYWKRKCESIWPRCPVWRHNDDWKVLFVERSVREYVRNFIPGQSDTLELKEFLKTFQNYTHRLEVLELKRRTIEPFAVDLADEDFDQVLDDHINKPDGKSVYLDFETVLGTLSELREFSLVLSPGSLDVETYHMSIPDFNSLYRGLKKLTNLKKLRCSNGFATLPQLVVLTKLHLQQHQNLSELDLSHNCMDDSVCDTIGKLLMSPCPLETLILKRNRITSDGAEAIAATLSTNRRLRRLDVSWNWVGDRGAVFLAKVLSLNSSLEDVDVTNNKLSACAGVELAEAIKVSKSLRSFKIASNNLGEDCGRYFHLLLLENQRIVNLDVKKCLFSPVDEDAIDKALIHNRNLLAFSFYV